MGNHTTMFEGWSVPANIERFIEPDGFTKDLDSICDQSDCDAMCCERCILSDCSTGAAAARQHLIEKCTADTYVCEECFDTTCKIITSITPKSICIHGTDSNRTAKWRRKDNPFRDKPAEPSKSERLAELLKGVLTDKELEEFKKALEEL